MSQRGEGKEPRETGSSFLVLSTSDPSTTSTHTRHLGLGMQAGATIEDIDYYAVLDVKAEASAQEIKTAYRQRSLKGTLPPPSPLSPPTSTDHPLSHPQSTPIAYVSPPPSPHPDAFADSTPCRHSIQNPDNPEAATLFHALVQAFDVLSDPTKKASFDALLAARNARKLRFQGLDNKRKALAEDLDRREKEFKRSKGEEEEGARRERGELERLKEEGRKMREAMEAGEGRKAAKVDDARREEEERKRRFEAQAKGGGVKELGPLDTTLRVKWAPTTHPTIVDAESLEGVLRSLVSPAPLDVDSVVLSAKFKANPKKGKHASAVVAFRTLRAAVRVMEGRENGRPGWDGIEVAWAAGAPPAILGGSVEEVRVEPPRSTFPTSVRPSARLLQPAPANLLPPSLSLDAGRCLRGPNTGATPRQGARKAHRGAPAAR